MELCKSVERKREVGIVGMRVLDVGLCSDRCKLKEMVYPYGNWWGLGLQGVRRILRKAKTADGEPSAAFFIRL